MLMQVPSLDAFNEAVDGLLQSLKYLKLNEFILKSILSIIEFIWKLFERIGNNVNPSDTPLRTKVILAIIVLLVLILTVVFILLMVMRKRRKKKVKTILGEKIDKNSTVLSFLDKSKSFEEEGQYRYAMRLHFIAVLFYLHQSNILYHDHTMTGLEMIDKLKKDGFKAIVEFESLVHQFNTVWYGMEEILQEQFKGWQDSEEAFWQEVKK